MSVEVIPLAQTIMVVTLPAAGHKSYLSFEPLVSCSVPRRFLFGTVREAKDDQDPLERPDGGRPCHCLGQPHAEPAAGPGRRVGRTTGLESHASGRGGIGR